MMNTRIFVAAAFVALLGGCASNTYEGRYAYDDGWRQGKVLEVATATTMTRKAFSDCQNDGSTRPADTRYAYVEYRRMQKPKWRIVPIDAKQPLKPGDLVYVQATDCNAPVVLRADSTDGDGR